MEKAKLKVMLEPDDSLACALHTHLWKIFVVLYRATKSTSANDTGLSIYCN